MKRNEVKSRLIRAAAHTPVPDRAESILREVGTRSESAVTEERSERRERRLPVWIPTIAAVLAACLLVAFIPWGKLGAPSGEGRLAVGKAQQVFSRELLALGSVVADDTQMIVPAASLNAPTELECLQIAHRLNTHLFVGDAFCDKERIATAYERNKDGDYAEWSYKLTVTYRDAGQYAHCYVAYFDETVRNAYTTGIEGVMLVNGIAYRLSGEREVERDEVELELRLALGDDRYVSISNETERNENEYEYAYYEGGRLVTGVSLEVSTEGGVRTAELEITENGEVAEAECVYGENGIRCVYESAGIRTEVDVTAEGAEYVYTFDTEVVIRLYR